MMVAYLHMAELRRVEYPFFSDANTPILWLLYPCRYKKCYIHLWPADVMGLERATASPRALIPVPIFLCILCSFVQVCLCVGWMCNPLRAVIHGGLFQTMPLYRSPFILAAGCLRAAGALWRILKEGSPAAAILYEETQLGPWLYCLKGAVQPKVKSRSRQKTWLNKEAVRESIVLLQIYCLFVQNQVKERKVVVRENKQQRHNLLSNRSRRANMKVERWVASRARLQMQRKTDGNKLDEDREDGITLQWVYSFLKIKVEWKGCYISVSKNLITKNDHLFWPWGVKKSLSRVGLSWGLDHVTKIFK